MCAKSVRYVIEELTCPKWTLAASKPATCSLFLKRSNGYVIVLLIIPAPLPQTRLLRFPWRRDSKTSNCEYFTCGGNVVQYITWVWSPPTSRLSSFGWWSQQLFKDIVGEELQPGVRKHRHQRWRQAAVKSQDSLRAPHCRHSVSQVDVHLRRHMKHNTGFQGVHKLNISHFISTSKH